MTAPANLPQLARAAFAKARAGGDLVFFHSQATVLRVGDMAFQLRFAPALALKPPGPGGGGGGGGSDPFADPPAALWVAPVGRQHYLVLNKFAVVREHLILATTQFQPQTHVLEAADLAAAQECMGAYGDDDGGLFVFFNSGPHSGASQPHRHLQLLPVANMRDGLPEGCPWTVLAAKPATLARAPFVAFVETLAPGADLHAVYLRLYRRACRAVAAHMGSCAAADTEAPAHGEARISYNMALTRDAMVLCPRLAEAPGGRLALNGTVLAGTALVKTEADWDALRQNPRHLALVLAKIGIPRDPLDGETEACPSERMRPQSP